MFDFIKDKTNRRRFLQSSTAMLSIAGAARSAAPTAHAQRAGTAKRQQNLKHDPKWCLFFDFHTQPACPDVGKTFDANAIADFFQECGVDYVVFPARCNLGMAYYNTRIGIRHPSLTYDMFGRLAGACEARGIALTAYINVGLSHEEGLLHREWTIVTEEGYAYRPDRLNHFFRNMCYNTPYAEHITRMSVEVVKDYPVAGLFFDCFHTIPCVGVECIREMKKLGLDWTNPSQLHDYNYQKILRMARRLSDGVRAIKPDLLLYFNGVDYEAQEELGSYLEFECLPTGGWGYESLPFGARYLRTLGKPVLNMTGRFHKSWGDFGGIRTEASLEYDCLYGIANAMRTTIGDHFHPRGDINRAVFDLDKRIYQRLQKLEPWLDQATALTDAAILQLEPYPGYKYREPEQSKRYSRNFNAMKGANRMLCELKMQFDVVSAASSWDRYQLLVLPDFITPEKDIASRIEAHLRKGGAILSTGWSGLDPGRQQFIFNDWGLRYLGDDPFDPAFIKVNRALAEGMPDMPVTLYERGAAVEALRGTEVLAEIVAPYYSRQWDGEHHFVYLPPDKPTGRPAATQRGKVGYLSHPVFTIYHKSAPVPMRQLVANLLARILPSPLLKTSGLPSFGRATITAQNRRRMVHLLAYVPERRGEVTEMIEEPIEVSNAQVALRIDNRPVRRVYLAPSEQEIPFAESGGYLQATVPPFKGYTMVVFEEG
jgi:hypothetical protein